MIFEAVGVGFQISSLVEVPDIFKSLAVLVMKFRAQTVVQVQRSTGRHAVGGPTVIGNELVKGFEIGKANHQPGRDLFAKGAENLGVLLVLFQDVFEFGGLFDFEEEASAVVRRRKVGVWDDDGVPSADLKHLALKKACLPVTHHSNRLNSSLVVAM
jgi:hypothetical protein